MITFKFIATDGKTKTIRSERNYDALIEQLEEKMNKKPWYQKDFEAIEVRDKENKINFNLYDYDNYTDVDIIINALEDFKRSELTFRDFIELQRQIGSFVAFDDISIYESIDEVLYEELEYHTISLEYELQVDSDNAFDYRKIFNIEYLKDLILNADNVLVTENGYIVISRRH